MRLLLAGDGLDPGIVLGWMLFPYSQELRELYLARNQIARLIDACGPDESISVPAGMMERILAGPGRKEFGDLAAESTKKGTVAGDMLALMMEQDHFGRPASKEVAVRLYSKFALGKKYGDGKPLKYSRATLLTYLDEYASVSHLWAAHRLNQFSPKPVDVFGTRKSLAVFLGVAKTLGNFANTYIPARVKPKAPLIPKSKILAIPDDIEARHVRWGDTGVATPI
jgi:hypothetical protein